MSISRTPASSKQTTNDRISLIRDALEPFRAEFDEPTWRAYWRITIDNRPPSEVAAELAMEEQAVLKANCRVCRRLREELEQRLD
jgi:RNA polymerase sigma-70 factor, ECF subfamily